MDAMGNRISSLFQKAQKPLNLRVLGRNFAGFLRVCRFITWNNPKIWRNPKHHPRDLLPTCHLLGARFSHVTVGPYGGSPRISRRTSWASEALISSKSCSGRYLKGSFLGLMSPLPRGWVLPWFCGCHTHYGSMNVWYISLHLSFTHKFKPNVGKYTIHGSCGIWMCFFPKRLGVYSLIHLAKSSYFTKL